jgi:hypothetical protein
MSHKEGSRMDTFWTLLKDSVITQSALTILLWGAVIYLVVTGQAVPDILSLAATSVLGFWFGSKISYSRSQQESLMGK